MYVSVLRGDCGKRYVSVLCVCWVGYWSVVYWFSEGNKFCVLRRCCWLTIWPLFLFLVVCGGADCVCRAHFVGWFCEGAASWVVGANSDRHSILAHH